ncbi:TolC family protein [Olivibacter ginsenosidimutans]
MKIILVLFLLVGVFTGAKAQESIIQDVNYNQLQQFIELAKTNYPRKKIYEAQEGKAKSGVPSAQVSLLEPLNASYIYRPEDKSAIDVNNPYLYNGFQFGVNLNLGTFLQKPFQIKQAKADYEIAKLENQEYNMMLATEVKSRYYEYIRAKSELKIKTQASQDTKSLYDDLKTKFERGQITHESYSMARNTYAEANSAKIEAEVNFLKAKDTLEEIIGVKLESLQEAGNAGE